MTMVRFWEWKDCFIVKDRNDKVERYPLFEREISEVSMMSRPPVNSSPLIFIKTLREGSERMSEPSWICDKCGSTSVFWDENVKELVCKNCGKIFYDAMPKLAVLSKDRVSERGTCQACGLENAHLIAKCQKCERKVCAEMCFEDLESDGGLCLWCRPPVVPY